MLIWFFFHLIDGFVNLGPVARNQLHLKGQERGKSIFLCVYLSLFDKSFYTHTQVNRPFFFFLFPFYFTTSLPNPYEREGNTLNSR